MFLEKIKSDGIAHLSYILGDGQEAAVIDPRRDCQIYIDIAARQGTRISRTFETHRNEDYITGSMELAQRTGATIHHGKALDFAFGEAVSEKDSFALGDLRLTILETPGHTFESISIAVTDTNFGDDTVAVFTGDTLMIGVRAIIAACILKRNGFENVEDSLDSMEACTSIGCPIVITRIHYGSARNDRNIFISQSLVTVP